MNKIATRRNRLGLIQSEQNPAVDGGERLVGTLRRECLDRTLFWTTSDLEAKLLAFRDYFNGYRSHAGLQGRPPEPIRDEPEKSVSFISYRSKKHCRGLYQTPIAA